MRSILRPSGHFTGIQKGCKGGVVGVLLTNCGDAPIMGADFFAWEVGVSLWGPFF